MLRATAKKAGTFLGNKGTDTQEQIALNANCPSPQTNASLLGLSCIIASTFMLINVPAPTLSGSSETPSISWIGLLAYALGGAACLAVNLAGTHRTSSRTSWKIPLFAGIALSFAGIACATLHRFATDASPALAISGAALLGASNSLLLVLWGRAYRAVAPKNVYVHAGVAQALGLTLCVAVIAFQSDVERLLLWIACQLVGCLSLTYALAKVPTVPARQSSLDGRTATPNTIRQTGIAISGLCVFSFLIGMYWTQNSSAIFYDSLLETTVVWATTIALIIPVLVRHEFFNFDVLHRIAVPVTLLLLLNNPFLLPGILEENPISGAALSLCQTVLGIVGWTALSLSAKHFSSHDGPFSASGICICASFVTGLAASAFVDEFLLKTVFVFADILIISAMVASVVLENRHRKITPPPPTPQPNLEEKARLIAERYGLSNRETEVFVYLIQGRGSTFISNELFISVNTVQTHRKHIYKKLGLSSREELIDLASSL